MSHYQQSFNRRAQMRIDVDTKVERYVHHCPAEMPSNVLSSEAIRAPVPRFVFALPGDIHGMCGHLDPSHYSRLLSGIAFRTAVVAFHQFVHRKSGLALFSRSTQITASWRADRTAMGARTPQISAPPASK
jgi:hypothetical protein